MNNLVVRAASGAVFVAIMIGGILFHQYSYLAVMLLVLAGSMNEFYNIIGNKRYNGSFKLSGKWPLIALSLLVFVASFVLASEPVRSLPDPSQPLKALFQILAMQRDSALALTGLVPVLLFSLFVIELFNKSEEPFINIGWNVLAVVYLLVPMVLTNQLYFQQGAVFLVVLFGIIWLYDSACYSFGSLFGKHKLMERVSPKKTIEGTIGGTVVTLAACWFVHLVPGLKTTMGQVQWTLLGAVIIAGATFGDLVESLLKRNLHIKDSGSIMPGHGGFLDRFDAYFFAVPFVSLMLWVFTRVDNLMLLIDYVKH